MAASTAVSAAAPVLTGVQKCAVLLIALGDQISGELLKRMSDEEVWKDLTRRARALGFEPPPETQH